MSLSPFHFIVHDELPREGPGDVGSTLKAFSMVEGFLPKEPAILDIGCGPGMQTLELAKISEGKITALDINQKFLDVLNENAKKSGQSPKINTILGSMFEMNFPEKSFDLIWAEGVIFIIGFEKGLKEWKKFLKSKGLIAVTHLSWLRDDAPDEPKKFWEKNCPEIASIKENLKILEKQGYEVLSHFVLPESAWWEDYYNPLERRLKKLRIEYKDNPEALTKFASVQAEIDLYRKFPDYYGYVFYIARLKY